jgi:hypothetical protein
MVERQTPSYDSNRFGDSRFQPIPTYENTERVPQRVIVQTDLLLRLYNTGAIREPEIARGYLHDYTLRFLDTAAQGVDRVFSPDHSVIDVQSLYVNEAADYTNVVFAWMHHFATSQFLPNGFSRRGMLQAPATREQFLQRTTEIKRELAFVVAGLRNPNTPLEARPSALRTHNFFHVGAIMPLKFPDSNRELAEKERDAFDRLLGDTKIDFP